jgi:hypothetical protein
MNSNSECAATPLAATNSETSLDGYLRLLEIEAQFGFLSVRANKKSQVKSEGRCGYNVASRHSLILLFARIKCVVTPRDSESRGFHLEDNVATLC